MDIPDFLFGIVKRFCHHRQGYGIDANHRIGKVRVPLSWCRLTPNPQRRFVRVPIEVSVNSMASGVFPSVWFAVKFAMRPIVGVIVNGQTGQTVSAPSGSRAAA
jgi:hypothetical protein